MYQFESKEQEVLKCTIRKFGLEAQLNQLTEECGELIAAVNHYRRNRAGCRVELVEEIVDVTIMLEQIVIALDAVYEISDVISIKINKLNKLS